MTRMHLWSRLLVFGLSTCLATTLDAQDGDQAALSIREAGRQIGHEDFSLRPARPGRPVGDSLITVARYPEIRPQSTITGVLQQSTKGAPLSLSLDYQSSRQGETILASVGRNRVTLRRVAKGAESARELPGGELIVLLDDSLFATYLSLASLVPDGPRSVTAIFPRTARRVALAVTRSALPAARPDGSRTLIEFTGELAGRLFLDQSGHFIRLELPGRQIEVTRLRK
ncbi:MAG: hypothetical protein ABI765_10160 [Gemmatimonadota bacterium]